MASETITLIAKPASARYTDADIKEVAAKGSFTVNGEQIELEFSVEQIDQVWGGEEWPELLMKQDGKNFYLFPGRKTGLLIFGKKSAWPMKNVE